MEEIGLEPMTQAQYDAWLSDAIVGYAHEHVVSGRWSEAESLQKSRDEYARLLPEGPATSGHRLWMITRSNDRQAVGVLWIHFIKTPRPHVFIYDIEIRPEFRRQGFAEAAMRKLEQEAKEMGAETIRLHVFGHNTAARPLYEKLGYVATNINMAKALT